MAVLVLITVLVLFAGAIAATMLPWAQDFLDRSRGRTSVDAEVDERLRQVQADLERLRKELPHPPRDDQTRPV